MIEADERAAMVALLRTGHRPWIEYAALVEERGSAAAVLRDEQTTANRQISLLPSDRDPLEADAEELLTQARDDLERWDASGIRLATVLDPDYPPNLRAVHDRPPIVFIAGRLTPADARAIAVVGTRQATDAGKQTATQIAEHLVDRGYTVVSGLAAGIDTAAHTAAITRGGRTLAVIGTGLNRTYPPENAELQRRIADKCAVISQFWPDAPPTRRSFPMRNAVMAGIALASVVVEASHTSGARMQTRLARAQGRPVFLAKRLVEQQDWAREAARRPGTYVIRNPDEITETLERLIDDEPLVA